MPDGIELPPDDLIKGLEEPLLNGEILHIDLVRPPQLLETSVHGLKHRRLDPLHGGAHRNPNIYNLRGFLLEVSGDEDVESGPEVEAADEEALHDALGLGEPGDHGVGAIGEGEDGDQGGVGLGAEEAGDEGLGGCVGEAVGVEDEEGGHGGGDAAGGEEVGDEDAGGDEEGGAAGV